jgi:hypothetical protein
MVEKWAQIEGFEGFYEVSDMGNVRSVDRLVERLRKGKLQLLQRKSIAIYQRRNYKGYQDVTLSKNAERSTLLVHRLVATAFCHQNGGDQVNHINSVRHDNRAENLEWCTGKENVAHAVENHPNKWGRKPIFALRDGVIVHRFESAGCAGRAGFNTGNISSALTGRLKTSQGFQWVFADQYFGDLV